MIIKLQGVSADGSFVLPAGHFIRTIIQHTTSTQIETVDDIEIESPVLINGGIKYGTNQDGDGNIVYKNTLKRLDINAPILDFINPTTIYYGIVGDWNNAIMDIYIVTEGLV